MKKQQYATTESGQRVILFANGTWEPINTEKNEIVDCEDCSEVVTVLTDEIEDINYVVLKETFSISSDGGDTGLVFSMMSPMKNEYMISIFAYGASNIIEKGNKAIIQFIDNSKITLKVMVEDNYENQALYFFGESFYNLNDLREFKEKKIKRIRQYTYNGFVDELFNDEQALFFQKSLRCLMQYSENYFKNQK